MNELMDGLSGLMNGQSDGHILRQLDRYMQIVVLIMAKMMMPILQYPIFLYYILRKGS